MSTGKWGGVREHAAKHPGSVDPRKVAQILKALDVDEDGEISLQEVKVMFGAFLNIPPEKIPDDNQEMHAFIALSREEQQELICEQYSAQMVNRCYATLFPPGKIKQPKQVGDGFDSIKPHRLVCALLPPSVPLCADCRCLPHTSDGESLP